MPSVFVQDEQGIVGDVYDKISYCGSLWRKMIYFKLLASVFVQDEQGIVGDA
jgi:hypothetical protein